MSFIPRQLEPCHPHDPRRGDASRVAAAQRLVLVLKGCARTTAAANDPEAAAAARPGELGRSEHNQVSAGRDAGQDQCRVARDQDALVEV